MKAETKKKIQLFLVIAILAAAVRLGMIVYQRHEANRGAERPRETMMDLDTYVVPKKLHAYDVASARVLANQPVWVREGYRYSCYAYDPQRHRADLQRAAGQLGPIEKLQISDVVTQPTPGTPSVKQILAIFSREGKPCATPIGTQQGDQTNIYADEIFYIQDPHELYKHWPADVWAAIDQRQVKQGMNEIQAAFALGMGMPHPMNGDEKTVDYPNGGHPVTLVFRAGRVAEINSGKPVSTRQTAKPTRKSLETSRGRPPQAHPLLSGVSECPVAISGLNA